MSTPNESVSLFTGPFYDQRRPLDNHDKRDNRPGANPYPPRLDRLVTMADLKLGPDGEPDRHFKAWRQLDRIVQDGIITIEGGEQAPNLATRIRDKHALAQEVVSGLITMSMRELHALVKAPRERKRAERKRYTEEGPDAKAA